MKKIIKLFHDYKLMVFVYFPVVFILMFSAFMLLRFPEKAAQGVKDGLEVSFNILVPSMYVFMIISTFFVESDIISRFEKIFSKVTNALFRLPGMALSVFVLSALGGYPIGPKCAENLYEKGSISRNQAQKLMLFCMNPSPAFTIGTVGHFMLHKKELGTIIYISIILASLIVALLSRYITLCDDSFVFTKCSSQKSDLIFAFINSVKQSAKGMINICAFVVLFSCLNSLVDLFDFSSGANLFVKSILEVTNGCLEACGVLPVPVIAAIISFGGLCTHCQVLPSIFKLRMNIKNFYTARVVSAALSAVICEAILKIVPVSYQTFVTTEKPEQIYAPSSLFVSIGLIILTVLFILGDDFVVIKKANTKENIST